MARVKYWIVFLFLLGIETSCQKSIVLQIQADRTSVKLWKGLDSAVLQHKPFIAMIGIKGCSLCDKYWEVLQNTEEKYHFKHFVLRHYLFDSLQNSLSKTMISVNSPRLLIFSEKGNLVNIIDGLRNEVQVCQIFNTYKIEENAAYFEYPSFMYAHKKDIIKTFDEILHALKKIYENKGILPENEFKNLNQLLINSVQLQPYFYNLYLYGYLNKGYADSSVVNLALRKALEFDSQTDIALYEKEMHQVRKFLDVSYDPGKFPVLEIDNKVINLGDLKYDSLTSFFITLKNTGSAPLIVKDVKTSCGCTDVKWKQGPLLPGESRKMEVVYRADKEGIFMKSVTITSNTFRQVDRIEFKGVVDKIVH